MAGEHATYLVVRVQLSDSSYVFRTRMNDYNVTGMTENYHGLTLRRPTYCLCYLTVLKMFYLQYDDVYVQEPKRCLIRLTKLTQDWHRFR